MLICKRNIFFYIFYPMEKIKIEIENENRHFGLEEARTKEDIWLKRK